MRGHVSFERSRILVFEVNDTKYSVRYTSFFFYPDKRSALSLNYLNIYNGETLLLIGRFGKESLLKLTGHLVDDESSHKFIFTNKMFTYINYDDIFKVLRKGEVKGLPN